MDKAIKLHRQYVASEIEKLQAEKDSDNRGRAIRALSRYHQARVQDFQHERLVHLLVTLFFGGLVLLSFTGVIVLSFATFDPTRVLLVLTTILACLLLVVELGYVWHYYKLENGVQGLYPLTEKLHHLRKG